MLNLALAQELAGLSTSFGKTWCYPTQQTILDRLRIFHGQDISLRTLNRHLAALVAAGWIERVCRHQPDKIAGWVFRSTLYILRKPVWNMLKRMAKAVAHVARWTRVPKVANNVTTTLFKSSPVAPTETPGEKNKDSAAHFAAEARKILAR